jgi:hypothetical protein
MKQVTGLCEALISAWAGELRTAKLFEGELEDLLG